jgi:TAG lipase/lysophosphatidylethanolamine acyltransferase
MTRALARLVALEIGHRLRQLNYLSLLPSTIARLLIEETVPGSQLTLVPDLKLSDFLKLFQTPDQASLAHWILKGERGVWPAVSALKVRCAVEIELDKGYQVVRRRKPNETLFPGPAMATAIISGSGTVTESLLQGRPQPNEGVPRKRTGLGSESAREKDPTVTLTSPDQPYS